MMSFGLGTSDELDSACNGILMHLVVEMYLDEDSIWLLPPPSLDWFQSERGLFRLRLCVWA
jgi:hypothetical protein